MNHSLTTRMFERLMTNNNKHTQLLILLNKAGVDETQRHNLVFAYTGGRTRSSKELFDQEINDLIWKLQNDSGFSSNFTRTTDILLELVLKGKRSQVLAIATRCGIHQPPTFQTFNHWMLNSSILKKKLQKYTIDELDQLLQQMHKLEANFKASAEKAGTKAWYRHYGIPEESDN